MEFLVCALIAAIFTGGRATSDVVHAVRGTEPPHLEKARLRAERQATRLPKQRGRSSYASGKPRLRDVAAVYWGDALDDVISHHQRVRAEKQDGTRPTARQRAKRLGRLLWEPVGEKTADPESALAGTAQDYEALDDLFDGDDWAEKFGPYTNPTEGTTPMPTDLDTNRVTDVEDAHTLALICDDMGVTTAEDYEALNRECGEHVRERAEMFGTRDTEPTYNGGAPMTQPTGEAVNYETTVNELEQIAATQREHVDHCTAAVKAIQDAKSAIAAAQQSYNPAATAAQSVNEHLGALNLDSETLGHVGTIADAMPPNKVDAMFDELEVMEQDANEQLANAETALGSTEAALQHVVATYGDAHATVAGNLGGNAAFLDSAGMAA